MCPFLWMTKLQLRELEECGHGQMPRAGLGPVLAPSSPSSQLAVCSGLGSRGHRDLSPPHAVAVLAGSLPLRGRGWGGGGAVPSRGPSSCRPGVGGGGAGPLRASLRMALPRTRWVTVCVPPACFCSVPASALARRPLRQFGLELGSLPWLCGSAPCPRLCPGGAHGRGQQPQSRRSARFPAALT